MNAETLHGPPSDGEDVPRPITLTCTEDERQILLVALGELLGSVQREEHLVPTILTLIKRVKNAELTGNQQRHSTTA